MARPHGSIDKAQRKTKSFWSPSNIKFLKENFYTMSYRDLCKALNKSKINVYTTAKEMGMIKPKAVPLCDSFSDIDDGVCGIYVVKNVTLDLYYIGASVNIRSRLRTHIGILNTRSHDNKILQRDWNNPNYTFRYGIWDKCDSSKLGVLEEEYIDGLDSNILYNVVGQVKVSSYDINKMVIQIEDQIVVDKDTNCWLMPRITKDGYGKIGRSNLKAHRVMYAYYFSDPYGYVVRHKCENKNCCNPNHLQLGWHSDNMKDRFENMKPGEASRVYKYKDEIILLNKKISVLKIAEKYSMSYTNMNSFIKSIGEWDNRYKASKITVKVKKQRARLITAWGEDKTTKDWAKDDRCSVCERTIRRRLKSCRSNEEAIGSKSQLYKIDPSKYTEIVAMRKSGQLIQEIADFFSVSKQTISCILDMNNWSFQ